MTKTIVNQILEEKGRQTWSVSPETTIYQALELMADKNIGAVIVLEDNDVVGIFSERDYARRVVLQGKSSRETVVGDAMTSPVICVRPDRSIESCMALMTEKRIRHLPVLRDGELVGVISIGDVVKAYTTLQLKTIQHLEDYITSGHPDA
jgi:CBS domain-containing protein